MTTREELIGLLKSHAKAWAFLQQTYRHDNKMVPYAEGDADEAEKAVLDVFDAQAARIAGLERRNRDLERVWKECAYAVESVEMELTCLRMDSAQAEALVLSHEGRIAELEADLKTERLRVEACKGEWDGLDRYYRAALARKDEYKSALARMVDAADEYKTALARMVDAGEAAWHNLMAVHPRDRTAHDLVTAARNGIRAALNAAREALDDQD